MKRDEVHMILSVQMKITLKIHLYPSVSLKQQSHNALLGKPKSISTIELRNVSLNVG